MLPEQGPSSAEGSTLPGIVPELGIFFDFFTPLLHPLTIASADSQGGATETPAITQDPPVNTEEKPKSVDEDLGEMEPGEVRE